MAQQGQEDSERSEGGRRSWATPVRVNLLVIVILIAALNSAIIYLVWWAITSIANPLESMQRSTVWCPS